MSYGCGGVSWGVCQKDDLDRSHVWGLRVPRTLFKHNSLFWGQRNARGAEWKTHHLTVTFPTRQWWQQSYWASLLKAWILEWLQKKHHIFHLALWVNKASTLTYSLKKRILFSLIHRAVCIEICIHSALQFIQELSHQIPKIHTIYKVYTFQHISEHKKRQLYQFNG